MYETHVTDGPSEFRWPSDPRSQNWGSGARHQIQKGPKLKPATCQPAGLSSQDSGHGSSPHLCDHLEATQQNSDFLTGRGSIFIILGSQLPDWNWAAPISLLDQESMPTQRTTVPTDLLPAPNKRREEPTSVSPLQYPPSGGRLRGWRRVDSCHDLLLACQQATGLPPQPLWPQHTAAVQRQGHIGIHRDVQSFSSWRPAQGPLGLPGKTFAPLFPILSPAAT